MNFKEYRKNILEKKLEEKYVNVEDVVDDVISKAKSKKEAIKMIEKHKDSFVKQNKKKIIDMLNKLPNSMF